MKNTFKQTNTIILGEEKAKLKTFFILKSLKDYIPQFMQISHNKYTHKSHSHELMELLEQDEDAIHEIK